MKTFEQLGKVAFETFLKEVEKVDPSMVEAELTTTVVWEDLPAEQRQPFIAVAKQLWAEFSLIH